MPPTRVSMQTASVAEHIPSVDTRTGHVTWEPPQPQQSSTSEEDDSTTSSSSTMMIQGTLAVTYACSQTKMEVQVLGTEGSLTPRRKRTARDIPSRFIVSRATATATPMLRNQKQPQQRQRRNSSLALPASNTSFFILRPPVKDGEPIAILQEKPCEIWRLSKLVWNLESAREP